MKEAIGGISLFQIAIVLLLVFTGVMCLTINHSKAFGVKDEIINILETDEIAEYGITHDYAITEDVYNRIIDNLNDAGYRITGECPNGDGWVGYTRSSYSYIDNNNASFCIKAVNVQAAYHKDIEEKCTTADCTPTAGDFPSMIYYDVAVFYQLDVPFIKELFNLRIYGSTKILFG